MLLMHFGPRLFPKDDQIACSCQETKHIKSKIPRHNYVLRKNMKNITQNAQIA